jgi:hypothetical protein
MNRQCRNAGEQESGEDASSKTPGQRHGHGSLIDEIEPINPRVLPSEKRACAFPHVAETHKV